MKSYRRISLILCVVVYGLFATAGIVSIHFFATIKFPDLLKAHAADAGLGLGSGVFIAVMCILASRFLGTARELEEEFGFLLGNHRLSEIIFLAVLSGFVEELFFRGFLQQIVGFIFASIIFALFHWPLNRRLLTWPLYALAVGLILGAQFQYTESLVAPMITHASVNFINLLRIVKKYKLLEV